MIIPFPARQVCGSQQPAVIRRTQPPVGLAWGASFCGNSPLLIQRAIVDRWTPVSAVISRNHKRSNQLRAYDRQTLWSSSLQRSSAADYRGRRSASNEPVWRSVGNELDSVRARFGDGRYMSGNPVGSVSTSLIEVGSADTWVDAWSYGTTKSCQQTYTRDDARIRLDETAFAIRSADTHTDFARQVSQPVADRLNRGVSTKVSTTARSPTIVGS
jgi:hypothetical protein